MQKHNNFDNFEVLYIRFVYELWVSLMLCFVEVIIVYIKI